MSFWGQRWGVAVEIRLSKQNQSLPELHFSTVLWGHGDCGVPEKTPMECVIQSLGHGRECFVALDAVLRGTLHIYTLPSISPPHPVSTIIMPISGSPRLSGAGIQNSAVRLQL